MVQSERPIVEFGTARRAFADETDCGDRSIVAQHSRGFVAAVIDGAGHGDEAAATAELAAAVVADYAGEDIGSLLRRCHDRLRGTRGAAATIASVDTVDRTLSWGGVGNVDAVLVRASTASEADPKRDLALVQAGTLGHGLPPFRQSVTSVAAGDILILATDGVGPEFLEASDLAGSAQDVAATILRRYALGSDDALVLVARVRS